MASPEMRLNLVTREWVIIAPERSRRPSDYGNDRQRSRPPLPPYLKTCPFCAGNESKTGEEFFRLPGTGPWKVRVVANKYPAVARAGEKKRVKVEARRSVAGVGLHDVIIESPSHDMDTALMEQFEVEDIIRVYQARFIEAHKDPRVEHVIVFKSRGVFAGTSIEHSHSQIIAVPVMPVQFRDRLQSAMHYFDDNGECLVCSIIRNERSDGARVVIETDHFITFVPYAALSPFHTWVMPKRHSASFSGLREDELKDMAYHLKTIMAKFYYSLEDPDYNYVIRSSAPRFCENDYSHWYLSIIPRTSKTAGFELGSGIFINSSLPEESAAFLRDAPVSAR